MGRSRKASEWEYLGKSEGERYRNTDTGQVVSRYRFNEIIREREGLISRKDQERLTRDKESTYNQWKEDVAQAQGISPKNVARYDSEFNRLYQEAKSGDFKDKSPESALAQLLTLAGYRKPEADYNVGETP